LIDSSNHKETVTFLLSSIIMTSANAYETFIDFVFDKTYSDNFYGSFKSSGSRLENGKIHLKRDDSFEIELGIRDNSGLFVGLQNV